jgi:hypothetical protein
VSEFKIERRRLFDWRLVMSLILAGALLFGAYAAIGAFHASDAKDRNTAVALAEVAKAQSQVHELIEQIKTRDAELRDQAIATQANTARFAANQAAMLRFQAEGLAWTRHLLSFIRTHPGQLIPASLLSAPTPPELQQLTPTPRRTSPAIRKPVSSNHAPRPKKHKSHKRHTKKK